MPEPEIVYEDPPQRFRQNKWLPVLVELRKNGRSARVATFDALDDAHKLANSLRHLAKKMGGRWEINGLLRPEGGAGVWVRCLTPTVEPEQVPETAPPGNGVNVTSPTYDALAAGGFLDEDPFDKTQDLGDHPPLGDAPWDNLPSSPHVTTSG